MPSVTPKPIWTPTVAKEATGEVSEVAKAKEVGPELDLGDAYGATKPGATHLVSSPATAGATVAGFPETFPLSNLSGIDGKGVRGTTFILDGGSLDGLQLGVRRVVDAGQKGFEVQLRLTHGQMESVTAAAKAAGGKEGPLTFRSAELGADGIVQYGKDTVNVGGSLGHMAASKVVEPEVTAVGLEREGGARFEIAVPNASPSLKGLVRIQLRGSDAECTKQLQSLVKELKLERLFEPTTTEAKTRCKLMRALWQGAHPTARALSEGDLSAVKPNDVVDQLNAAGYDDERIARLRWEEVFPGYATVLDPAQQKQMVAHGARYLYSTVKLPEHVLSILQHGQKASLTRYREGLLVEGMSTHADIASGGAVGVFTRLVTQMNIDEEQSWAGRTYKIILKPEILQRTDFYGWSSDNYGKSYDLSPKNFGTKLADSISSPHYNTLHNELIFRTGTGPQFVSHVVATTDEDRGTLIAYLKENGYQPPNGKSVEDFVVLSPTMQ